MWRQPAEECVSGTRATARGHWGERGGDQTHGRGPQCMGAGRRAGRQPSPVGVRGWPFLPRAAPCGDSRRQVRSAKDVKYEERFEKSEVCDMPEEFLEI